MTREEAIKTLKENYCAMCAYGSQDMDSCDIRSCDNKDAIKALEQESCEDCISREAAIDAIWDGTNMDIYTREVKETIESLPSVQPKQRTGRWVLRDDINGQYQCEECGMFTGLDRFDVKEVGFELPKYCSNCGRRNMEAQE